MDTSLTWTYDSEGLVTHITSHEDTTPDTTSWFDATNQIKYTYNADDDIDDAGDDVVVNEDFGGTSTTFTHDDNGNLTDDGVFKYTYDAWNRMVKVTASNDTDVTLQTAEYDGTGRRMKKVVTNSSPLDGTVVYLYDGWKICETRDGSDVMVQQFIHGTQYIDELVMVRVKDKGDLYVHQDANWNVVALTDLGTHLVERYVYTPYGELIVEQETSFGDRDGDADVDSTDKGTPGSTCTGTVTGACRILDLDFDGDYDSSDATLFDALPSGIARHPGRASTGVAQPFAHQGLLYDTELASYQNRHRQYDPAMRRFLQRDPLTTSGQAGSGYQDGANLFNYHRSNPLIGTDATGTTYCGRIACECGGDIGDSEINVYGDSRWPVVPIGVTCITWPLSIHCRVSCEDAEDSLSHECCHHCHWRQCIFKYIKHAINDICYDPSNEIPWHWV